MLKHQKIFQNLVLEFKKDSTVEGVLVNGSVAVGTATELSDLDLLVFGKKEAFESSIIDGVTVEIQYMTLARALERLKSYPMEVYKYLDAKIGYDGGKMQEIITHAENIFAEYSVSEREQREIVYWLKSTKLKLTSAFFKNDMLCVAYLTATNTWKVLEGIWAVNQKPIPPSSSLYRSYTDLSITPCENWFEQLFTDDVRDRGQIMLVFIDWILQRLE